MATGGSGRSPDSDPRTILPGWTPQLRDRKIDHLASVIAAMDAGQRSDLLGVCEIETRLVVHQLGERAECRSACTNPQSAGFT